jgi:hypothetical protein
VDLRVSDANPKLVADPAVFMLSSNAPLVVEMKNLPLVYALLGLYLLMMAPYIVRVKVDQIVQVFVFFQLKFSAIPLTMFPHIVRQRSVYKNSVAFVTGQKWDQSKFVAGRR